MSDVTIIWPVIASGRWAENVAGGGAAFRSTLPVTRDDAA
jgi:hypothetical protein